MRKSRDNPGQSARQQSGAPARPRRAQEESQMATPSSERIIGVNDFFAASEARVDRWRTLNRVARALAGGGVSPAGGHAGDPKALLAELAPLEALCGYPGPRLMSLVHERLQTGDFTGFSRLVQRISGALLSNSYRDDPESRRADEEGEARMPDLLPKAMGRAHRRQPIFELLIDSRAEHTM